MIKHKRSLKQPGYPLSFKLFPARCILCGRAGQPKLDLCLDCEKDFPTLGNACAQCAHPLPATEGKTSWPQPTSNEKICGQCLQKAPSFDRCLIPWRYEFFVDQLLKQFKFQKRLAYGQVLATLLGRFLRQHYRAAPDKPKLLIPVPLHTSRLQTRGFNQASLIADHLGASLQIPLNHQLISREKNTTAQFGLSATARKRNLSGAFRLNQPCKAIHVAIIDDIMTTGSTVAEMSRTLKQAGVKTVTVFCLARALQSTPFS